ncbi:uncharacterized protein DS421_13g421810 [Arachis hypogaea]|nr:uncharacterized protein DS421_13g421810 [Arachis hypogaea]
MSIEGQHTSAITSRTEYLAPIMGQKIHLTPLLLFMSSYFYFPFIGAIVMVENGVPQLSQSELLAKNAELLA